MKNVLDKLHLAFDYVTDRNYEYGLALSTFHSSSLTRLPPTPYSPTSHHIMSFQQHDVRSHVQSQWRYGNEICPAIQKMSSWL